MLDYQAVAPAEEARELEVPAVTRSGSRRRFATAAAAAAAAADSQDEK